MPEPGVREMKTDPSDLSSCCYSSTHYELGFEAWFRVCDKCGEECNIKNLEAGRE